MITGAGIGAGSKEAAGEAEGPGPSSSWGAAWCRGRDDELGRGLGDVDGLGDAEGVGEGARLRHVSWSARAVAWPTTITVPAGSPAAGAVRLSRKPTTSALADAPEPSLEAPRIERLPTPSMVTVPWLESTDSPFTVRPLTELPAVEPATPSPDALACATRWTPLACTRPSRRLTPSRDTSACDTRTPSLMPELALACPEA